MAIKKKIDNLTSNIFLSISRISIVRTISNTLSSVFQIRAIKYAYVAFFVLFTSGIVNALVNAGWSKGLGAVINSQGIMQSPVVREYAGIPEDQVIMICVAMGYPDESFPANEVVSKRRPISEVATFVGFEE